MDQLNRVNQLAPILLLIGAARHYGWLMVDVQSYGVASKGLGALAAMALLWVLSRRVNGFVVLWVMLWYGFEELLTATCSFAYLIAPWPVEVGQSMCSARIGFDIGAIGIFVVGLIAYKLVNKNGP